MRTLNPARSECGRVSERRPKTKTKIFDQKRHDLLFVAAKKKKNSYHDDGPPRRDSEHFVANRARVVTW